MPGRGQQLGQGLRGCRAGLYILGSYLMIMAASASSGQVQATHHASLNHITNEIGHPVDKFAKCWPVTIWSLNGRHVTRHVSYYR